MKRSVALGTLLAVALGHSAVLAQAAEYVRGFPYSSGESWSGFWGVAIALFVLLCIFGLAGAVKDVLKEKPFWHTIAVVVATVAGACAIAGALYADRTYSPELGFIVFMLIPSFFCIGLLYLAVTKERKSK